MKTWTRLLPLLALVISLVVAPRARAELIQSRDEFEKLATELAPKVNLFHDVWSADPAAEFFGGTSRDYLYWLKGKFRNVRSRAEYEVVVEKLRTEPLIDIREFILFESDVDLVSKTATHIDARNYGVKKLDFISLDRFDTSKEAGRNEIDQGHIPVEKIRLTRKGFVKGTTFGDGVGEIFTGRPTIHFSAPAKFESTAFAKQKINHPVLLATRFIRILAMDYFQTYGRGAPSPNLISRIDPASSSAVASVIARTISDGNLNEYLHQPQFKKWMNDSIQKAFRSYTNPTATMELAKHFGLDQLVVAYHGLEPVNQYLFAQTRDAKKIAANFARYRVTEAELLVPAESMFEGLRFYHGTRYEKDFRAILFQGILPSNGGSAGPGLYGVAKENVDFAVKWAGGDSLVVEFELSPETRIADLTKEPAASLLRQFGGNEEKFAEAFGIDVLKYPYSTDAFVIKNGSVIKSTTGYTRKLMKFSDLLRAARKLSGPDALVRLIEFMEDNALTRHERSILANDREVKSATRGLSRLALDFKPEQIVPSRRTATSDAFTLKMRRELDELREILAKPAASMSIAEIESIATHGRLFGATLDAVLDDLLARDPSLLRRLAPSKNADPHKSNRFNTSIAEWLMESESFETGRHEKLKEFLSVVPTFAHTAERILIYAYRTDSMKHDPKWTTDAVTSATKEMRGFMTLKPVGRMAVIFAAGDREMTTGRAQMFHLMREPMIAWSMDIARQAGQPSWFGEEHQLDVLRVRAALLVMNFVAKPSEVERLMEMTFPADYVSPLSSAFLTSARKGGPRVEKAFEYTKSLSKYSAAERKIFEIATAFSRGSKLPALKIQPPTQASYGREINIRRWAEVLLQEFSSLRDVKPRVEAFEHALKDYRATTPTRPLVGARPKPKSPPPSCKALFGGAA
ncbi:MAG: hypothetical protein V4760_03795 [Bdellovibrionota bacterium]